MKGAALLSFQFRHGAIKTAAHRLERVTFKRFNSDTVRSKP